MTDECSIGMRRERSLQARTGITWDVEHEIGEVVAAKAYGMRSGVLASALGET
jgi:hypothetical protein